MIRRVVITGMGIVSPCGSGVEYVWKNIVAGKSGIEKITKIDVSDMTSQIAGVPKLGTSIGECNIDTVVDLKEQKRMDLVSLYALVAANEAIKDAKLGNIDLDRAGVSIGSGIGGINNFYEGALALINDGPRRVSPFFIPKIIGNMPAGHVSIKYGFKGPNICIVTACATGTHSIGEGVRLIQHGDADVMICGGTEAAVTRLGISGFCSMKALSTRNDEPHKASRPWDKERDGFVMAEGAGILILEEYEHAKKRSAKIYAEVVGYGMSSDAHHITAPAEDGNGGFRAMQAAIKDARLKPEDVDYINAHGTSTGLGDLGELAAVKTLFKNAPNVSMSSTKSMTGHLLGAAGAVEAIFSVLAIRDGVVPPTINLDDPEDMVGDFDLVPNVAKKKTVNVAISNSFGFGGTNTSLVLKKI